MTMTKEKIVELTQESYTSLQSELQDLQENQLPNVIDRIAKAREQGDLSENSEYKDAKDQQELLEVRIGEIQEILAAARIVKEQSGGSAVGVGSKVTLKTDAGEVVYEVVGEFDKAAVAEKTVSAVSPIGKALMGRKVGETVVVEVPAGQREFVIKVIK
jgi:transcription elongation factor GreA